MKLSKKNEDFASNVARRGQVPESRKVWNVCLHVIDGGQVAKSQGYTVGPILLGFFLFVVVGSGKQHAPAKM